MPPPVTISLIPVVEAPLLPLPVVPPPPVVLLGPGVGELTGVGLGTATAGSPPDVGSDPVAGEFADVVCAPNIVGEDVSEPGSEGVVGVGAGLPDVVSDGVPEDGVPDVIEVLFFFFVG